MGHALPEQQGAYINKNIESWQQTYKEQAEPWLTPPTIQEQHHLAAINRRWLSEKWFMPNSKLCRRLL